MSHRPVLHGTEGESPVLALLSPKPGETVLDVTVGLGGHAASLKKEIGPSGRLIVLDADQANLDHAKNVLEGIPGHTQYHHANFRSLADIALPPCDIIFADLGVSSPHFDDPERGFSFRADGPLDLRFDRSKGRSAAAFLARAAPDAIAEVLRSYGELRGAGKLAHALSKKARTQESPLRTTDVRSCVEELFGYKALSILPQVFQALRIAVNDEIGALQSLLHSAPKLLKPRGRFGVIAYHSLEDRAVKQAFRSLSTPEKDPEKGGILRESPFELLTKKPVTPSPVEIEANPRSRSARLRVLRRRA
ncbi:16S rRNA (cytosine(1402)-N(4))-methyltransferase RsmH [Candidatus Peregrinibacteria bacterium]|nr:16S rRNA (cytosine(1402)-N(4))-methyltransferase RsmH [Candidatus Peregrinibacteria bacterium]